jgi:hypothetical protein
MRPTGEAFNPYLAVSVAVVLPSAFVIRHI